MPAPMITRAALHTSLLVAPLVAQTWNQITTTTSPSARSQHAMVYDAARGKVVLFGGTAGGGETWLYDAQGWVQLSPAHAPSPRERHVMCYDSQRQVVVLFGGRAMGATTPVYGDTWEWDGTDWSQRTSTTQPQPRIDAAMAFDPLMNRTVLYGGNTAGTDPNDTWLWDGTAWTQVTSAVAIGRGTRGVAFFEARRGKVQVAIDGQVNMEMWEFGGTDWTMVVDHTGGLFHPDRVKPAGSYDATRQCLLTFGGAGTSTGQPNNDLTEEWDSYLWYRRNPTPRPAVRAATAMAYDTGRGVTVLFGGLGTGSATLGDTWEWTNPYPRALATRFGANCPAPNVQVDPTLDPTPQMPVIGTTFRARSTGGNGAFSILLLGWSRTSIGGTVPLPFDLTMFGLTGCNLLVDLNLDLYLPVRDANWDLPIPGSANLIGLTGYLQAIVTAAGANPANLATSNGLEFTLGG